MICIVEKLQKGGVMKKIIILLGVIAVCFSQEFDEKDPRLIIEKVKIWRITQELDLTTAQAEKFFPRLHELHKIEREFHDKRTHILAELESLLAKNAAEAEIIQTMNRYDDMYRKKSENEMEKLEEMWQVLTPIQRAKYVIFEEEFIKEIRNMIREIKKHQLHKP